MKAEFIVARYIPRDIHRYSHATGAVVLLAAALDWDVIEKSNRATILRKGDVVIEMPTGTNLKFNVYRSWIHKLVTYAADFVLPMDVAEKICDVAKLSPDHRRVIIELAAQSVIPDATPDEVPVEPEPHIVSRLPYQARLGGGVTYESDSSYERVWSDGHVDYECTICGKSYATSKGAGSHRQIHIKSGEADSNWRDRIRKRVKAEAPPLLEVPPALLAEAAASVALDGDTQYLGSNGAEPDLLRQSLDTLSGYVTAVLAENERLHGLAAENEDLRTINEQLRSQLARMRSDKAAMLALMQELQD